LAHAAKKPKNASIPNAHPLKEELLNELAQQKLHDVEEKEREKENRKRARSTGEHDVALLVRRNT
jgi:hypothetical protein